jgi:hypothetical protein
VGVYLYRELRRLLTMPSRGRAHAYLNTIGPLCNKHWQATS